MTSMGVHGEGGISPTRDGRLAVRVTMASGQRLTRMVSARLVANDPKAARRLAEQWRRELVEARDLELDPTRQTLAAYLRSWIRNRRDAKQKRLRPRTAAGYSMIVEQHIVPVLGDLPLARVNRRRIQAWVDGMTGSPQSIENRFAVLRKALNGAVGDLIARNPADGVELPDVDEFEGDPLTVDEARSLLEATRGDALHALWRLALVTGLRQGELLGLGWDDFDGRQLTVSAQLQRLDGQWVRSPTKAARSLHRIALDPATIAVLEKHRLRQAAEREPEWEYWGLIFVNPAPSRKGRPPGQPYFGADVLRAFKAACRRAAIRERRFHDLRASTATLMRELGVTEDTRQARLGHSTKAMARHYAKASEEQDRLAVELLAEALA